MNNVICKVCNQSVGVKGISIHLSKLHNIKFIDYVKQHMNDFIQFSWQWCDNCGLEPARKFASSNKKWATCSRQCAGSIKSISYKGRTPWNKGMSMSVEYKNKLSAQRRGRPGTPHTNETKQKLSKIAKFRVEQPDYVNPMKGKTHTPEAIMKIGKRVGSKLELLGKKIVR